MRPNELVICGYPIRDLDRLMSFYLAAKTSGRFLVIDLKQAYLLKIIFSILHISVNYTQNQMINILKFSFHVVNGVCWIKI